MKAKEWAAKFEETKGDAELVNAVKSEFALETRELVDKRTANSKPDMKLKNGVVNGVAYATDGVMREQRQKWEAVCRLTNTVKPNEFDSVLTAHLNDVKVAQDEWANKLAEAKQPKAEKETKVGRKLATLLAGVTPENTHEPVELGPPVGKELI